MLLQSGQSNSYKQEDSHQKLNLNMVKYTRLGRVVGMQGLLERSV